MMAGKKSLYALPELRCQCGKIHGHDDEHSPNRPMGTLNLREILAQSHTKSKNSANHNRTKASSHLTSYTRIDGGSRFGSSVF